MESDARGSKGQGSVAKAAGIAARNQDLAARRIADKRVKLLLC
jgi:hypothetical protein